MVVFLDPVSKIVAKLRANSDVTARVTSSKIHASYPHIPASGTPNPDKPGIYVHQAISDLKPVYGSSNLTEPPRIGSADYQIDIFSEIGVEDAAEIGRLAYNAIGDNVQDGGLFSIYVSDLGSSFDTGFNCYHAIFILKARYREQVSGVV
jgi:hypothetical protein